MIRTLLVAALLCVVCSSESYARSRYHHSVVSKIGIAGCSDPVMRPCNVGAETQPKAGLAYRQRSKISSLYGVHRRRRGQLKIEPSSGLRRVMAEGAGMVVGGRPLGCPRAFCGCGASLYLFGKIVPALNLAANWLRFPRAEPAPGMVAARRGHVFVLVRHISGKVWLAHDSNSGHHRTRIHPRSIAGFAIVDPRDGA